VHALRNDTFPIDGGSVTPTLEAFTNLIRWLRDPSQSQDAFLVKVLELATGSIMSADLKKCTWLWWKSLDAPVLIASRFFSIFLS
jgi:hypothetical protein